MQYSGLSATDRSIIRIRGLENGCIHIRRRLLLRDMGTGPCQMAMLPTASVTGSVDGSVELWTVGSFSVAQFILADNLRIESSFSLTYS